MKHNLKADGQPSLDQYFDAARNEPPLMEDDAFASIIDKADAAPTEIMKQSPTSRIVSAIRQQQGGMIMTGLGLTALTGLLVTGYYLSPADPEQTAKLVAALDEPAATSIEVPITQSAAAVQDAAWHVIHQVDPASSSAELATSTDPKPAQFRHPLSLDSIWSRVKIESLKPIEITAHEIDELGVNDGGDGKVFLVHELNKGGVRMKMAFPPTGMDAAYDIRVGNADPNDDTELTPVMPTMVTDAKGKKLAFFFKSQTNSNSINIQSASMSQRDGFDGNDPGSNIPEVSMNIDIVNTDDAGAGDEIENELQEIFSTFPDIPEGSMQLEFDDSRIKIDSLMKRRGGLGAKMMVFDGSDSAFKGKFDFDFKLDRDSLDIDINALMEQAKGMQQHALKIRINADSLRAEAMRMLKGLDLDSMHQNVESIRKQVQKRFRIDSTGGFLKQLDRLKDLPQLNHLQKLPGKKSFDLPIIQIDLEQINKLIPVKIRDIDPSVKYNQNGLIFWYARDEKFADKAPASLRERSGRDATDRPDQLAVSSVSAISAPMIYPNPTPGRTTFKYSLSAPRAVSMAVHDLLGKQVMKVTNLETKAAGTFEKELDLSSLEAGVYLLIIVTDVGEQITQRVVVEK